LTRVDYEDNSYRVFTYDDNGNCTKEEYYSGTYLASTVVVPQLYKPPCQGGKGSSAFQGGLNTVQGGLQKEHDWNSLTREQQQTLKKQMLEDNERLQATREHYPYTKAPPSLLRSRYLSPYTPEITSEDVFEFRTLQLTNPTMAEYMRNLMWNPHTQAPRNMGDSNNAPLFEGGREALLSRGVSYYDPFAVNPADEETDYEYDKENRLVEVALPSGVVVEFLYDGIGRRLSKVITDDTGDDTLITTWKYHWLGGQITTIEVDAIEDDGETQTAVRDETLHIHLGPNGQPLSFEWVRYDYSTLSCPPSEGGIQGGFQTAFRW